MRGLLLAVLALAALSPSACGAGEPGAAGVSTSRSDEQPPEAGPAPEPSQLYEADVMVFEADEGPMLCLGAVRLMLPPQCGDLPITDWDWDAVEGEESDAGATWGTYHVVGRLEGDAFTVTEVGPSDRSQDDFGTNPDFEPPCPAPDGGWVDVDPSKASERDFDRGASRAHALLDFVALWVAFVGDPTPEELEQLDVEGKPYPQRIMNVVVTGDPAVAEAAIRSAWGGPLCVVQRQGRTEKELRAIRRDAERWLQEELGLRMLWSQEGPLGQGAAEVGVIVDLGGAGQVALDERYGSGMVRLFPALRLVE
jgi:hypothetical protein